jgi:cell wall-associated NlpC family hydrolase
MTAPACFVEPEVICAEAVQWLGTPYVRHAQRRGEGCDCLGLILGVRRAVLGHDYKAIPYALRTSPALDQLPELHRQMIAPVSEKTDGAIAVMALRGGQNVHHLGFFLEGGAWLLHCVEERGVILSRSAGWRGRTIALFGLIKD